MAAGILIALLGVWLIARTVIPDQPNGNLVDRILGTR